MRALVILLLLAGTARAERRGFDHSLHEGQAMVGGAESPACGHCHALGARDRPVLPGHQACFSAGCHAESKTVDADNQRVCAACHAPPTGKKQVVGAPGWASGADSADFNLRFAHDQHAGPSQAARGCLTCHATPETQAAQKPAPVHARCASCHQAGARLPMASCEACHQAVVGRARAPEQVDSAYGVAARFQHDRHLGRLRGEGDACLVCHAEVARTAGPELPAPSMRGCESCHDGKQAFSALVGCRSCHQKGQALPSDAPRKRFEHRGHPVLGACASCHGLDPAGEPRPIGHTACNDAACHADDFRSPRPTICGGCHVGSEPWRPLAVDVGRPARSELGVEFSHVDHASRQARACSSCHQAGAAVPMRLTAGHASCSGAGCHGDRARPAFAECQACHQLGLLPARDQRRQSARWSVAARFSHARHTGDEQQGELACLACHAAVASATRISDLPPPGKPSCQPCHDGKRAFKMTGHGCNRCHTQAVVAP